MNAFSELGHMQKSAGAWGALARQGTRMAANSGRVGRIGRGMESAGNFMSKSRMAKGLGIYGMAGLVNPDLPGSQLAMNIGMPVWAAANAVPGLIRSGRMATGDYAGKIEEDARYGAQAAGMGFLDVASRDPSLAVDPRGYDRAMREAQVPAYDPRMIESYRTGNFGPGPSWFSQLGNAAYDPTALALPQVRQRIYGQLQHA
jgi:hypothetical protein